MIRLICLCTMQWRAPADGETVGTPLSPKQVTQKLLAICRPSGCTVLSGVVVVVVVVVGVCDRSQIRISKCTRLIFGVSIGLDPG